MSMGTPVVSLDRYRRQTPDWSNDDLAEFSRAHVWLRRVGIDVEIDQGISDEGDRWLAFYLASSGDVIVHFAKIAGTYCIDAPALGCSIRGRHFRKMVSDLLQAQPSSAHRSAHGAISLHPGSILLGLLLACIGRMALHSSEAQAAELPLNRKTLLPPPTEGETRTVRGGLILPSASADVAVPALHRLVVGSPVWSDTYTTRHISVGTEPLVGASMHQFVPQHAWPHSESGVSPSDGPLQSFGFDAHVGGSAPMMADTPLFFATQPQLLLTAGSMPMLELSHGLPATYNFESTSLLTAPKLPSALSFGNAIRAESAETSSSPVGGANSYSAPQATTATISGAAEIVSPSTSLAAAGTASSATSVKTDTESSNSAPDLDQAAALVASHTGGDLSHLATTPNTVIGQISALLNSPGGPANASSSAATPTAGGHGADAGVSTTASPSVSGTTNVAQSLGLPLAPSLSLSSTDAASIDADIGRFIQAHPNYQVITINHETILFDPGDLGTFAGGSMPVETFAFSDGSVVALVGVSQNHSLVSS